MKPRKKAVSVKASLFTSLGENWAHLRKNAIALTLGGIFLLWGQASFACSRHDHGCVYHGFGSTVHTTNPIASSTDNTLVIYAIGTKNGQPSTVDFDNKVLIPALTSSDLFPRAYYVSTGPYIISTTAYGATHPPPDWNPGGNDAALQVYPSRYQVVFNQNTAIAKHNGEFNGGENGNIPGATGCPNMPTPRAVNCESVTISGNTPNGYYEQRVRLFNFFNVPNPEVDIQLGAYTTGTGRLISVTHIPATGNGKEIADFITLTGTGDISQTYRYEYYNPGFDPHAAGSAWFDLSKSRTARSKPYTAGSHIQQDIYGITDTKRTTVHAEGGADYAFWTNSRKIGTEVIGEVEPPPPPPTDRPMNILEMIAAGYPVDMSNACIGENCSRQSIMNFGAYPEKTKSDLRKENLALVADTIVKWENDGNVFASTVGRVALAYGVAEDKVASSYENSKNWYNNTYTPWSQEVGTVETVKQLGIGTVKGVPNFVTGVEDSFAQGYAYLGSLAYYKTQGQSWSQASTSAEAYTAQVPSFNAQANKDLNNTWGVTLTPNNPGQQLGNTSVPVVVTVASFGQGLAKGGGKSTTKVSEPPKVPDAALPQNSQLLLSQPIKPLLLPERAQSAIGKDIPAGSYSHESMTYTAKDGNTYTYKYGFDNTATRSAQIAKGQSSVPRNSNEVQLFEQAKTNPQSGTQKKLNSDPVFDSRNGWQKMEISIKENGVRSTVHYQYNKLTHQVSDIKAVVPVD